MVQESDQTIFIISSGITSDSSMQKRIGVTLSLEATIILTEGVSEDIIHHIRKWNDVQINGIELRAINSQLNYDMSE